MATDVCEIPSHNPPQEDIRALLLGAKRIAIVGLSDKPERDSYGVARYLIAHGYDVIPVNPAAKEILGRSSHASLAGVPGPIDIVDIFRKSEAVPAIVQDAIRLGARAIWMQFGVVHEHAARQAEEAGLVVVQSRCIKIDHMRVMGSAAK